MPYLVVRNDSPWGKNKLKDQWENSSSLVLEDIENLPVNVVQEKGTGKRSTLHHNLLFPYHAKHKKLQTTVGTDKGPRQRFQSLVHPGTDEQDKDDPVNIMEESESL